jgi:chromosome segregation ATPase
MPEVAEEVHAKASEPAEPAGLALSVDEFAALEERVLRAVNLVKRERMAREAAETQARELEAKVAGHAAKLSEHEDQILEHLTQVENLQGEVKTLRSERDHVRQRVERLLSQLDSLEI